MLHCTIDKPAVGMQTEMYSCFYLKAVYVIFHNELFIYRLHSVAKLGR